MSSAREYEGRLRFGQKLSHGGPLKMEFHSHSLNPPGECSTSAFDKCQLEIYLNLLYWWYLQITFSHPASIYIIFSDILFQTEKIGMFP